MGAKVKTRANYAKMEKSLVALREVYFRAKHFGFTSDELAKAKLEVFSHPRMVGRTQYELGLIRGYERALWDNVWTLVIWRLGTVETGPIPENATWDYKKGIPTHGGHFWKGTDKPFTEFAEISK